MLSEQFRLGRFGDGRLDKGGRPCSKEWSRAPVRACGERRMVIEPRSFDMADFSPMRT